PSCPARDTHIRGRTRPNSCRDARQYTFSTAARPPCSPVFRYQFQLGSARQRRDHYRQPYGDEPWCGPDPPCLLLRIPEAPRRKLLTAEIADGSQIPPRCFWGRLSLRFPRYLRALRG